MSRMTRQTTRQTDGDFLLIIICVMHARNISYREASCDMTTLLSVGNTPVFPVIGVVSVSVCPALCSWSTLYIKLNTISFR
jgi:hypothetical protein